MSEAPGGLAAAHARTALVLSLFTVAYNVGEGIVSINARVVAATTDPTYRLPLKPSRIVRFTVDEGTWMSVDVSPDGRRFLMMKERAADHTLAPPHLVVIQHLDLELKRLAP